VLFSNKAPRHKGILGEWRYSSTHSLTSALYRGEWSTSRPCRFTPRGKNPWYPLDMRLGVPQSRSGRGDDKKSYLIGKIAQLYLNFTFVLRLITYAMEKNGEVLIQLHSLRTSAFMALLQRKMLIFWRKYKLL
jgi:hypothetical protein